MVYGVADAEAGIADVVNVSVNVPPVPVVVVLCVRLSIVTVTVSPAGGCNEPELNVPLRLMDGAPTVMDCDAVTVLNVVVVLFTVSAVAVLVAGPKVESPP